MTISLLNLQLKSLVMKMIIDKLKALSEKQKNTCMNICLGIFVICGSIYALYSKTMGEMYLNALFLVISLSGFFAMVFLKLIDGDVIHGL